MDTLDTLSPRRRQLLVISALVLLGFALLLICFGPDPDPNHINASLIEEVKGSAKADMLFPHQGGH